MFEFVVSHPPVGIGRYKVRVQPDSLAVTGNGVFELAHPEIGVAPVEKGIHIVRR